MTTLFGIFGTPTFTPLTEHMALVLKCSEALQNFFNAVTEEDWDLAHKHHLMINDLEDQADKIKENIRLHLPKSLLMSVERTDILDILSLQDRIANKAKHLSGVVLSRKMKIPSAIQADFSKFVLQSISTVACLYQITSELQSLFNTHFRKKEAEKMEELIHSLDKIEDNTDILEIELRDQVFIIEKEMNPVDVIFLYKLIDWVSDLADRSQRCAHRFLLLIAQ